jgi:hypothetical protein
MSITTTIRQHARALIGGKVAIGDCIRLTIDGAACTAIVLDTGTVDMQVTGFYEDGTRWHELVRYTDAWHATPRQIARLQAVASPLELDLIAVLCESNAAKEAAWVGKAAG